MKTIVFCGKYIKIIKYFAVLYNKYFDKSNQVIVLCSEESLEGIDKNLPDNFKYVACVKQSSSSWVEDIYPFFNSFDEPFFHACMEDHFLYNYVNKDIINKAIELIKSNKIDKLVTNHPDYNFNWQFIDEFKVCSLVDKEGPTSLLPSIWRTGLFKEMLENVRGKTAWDFELFNMTKLNELNCGRYKFAYHPYNPEYSPYPSVDLVRRGVDNKSYWINYVNNSENLEIFDVARKEAFNYD